MRGPPAELVLPDSGVLEDLMAAGEVLEEVLMELFREFPREVPPPSPASRTNVPSLARLWVQSCSTR